MNSKNLLANQILACLNYHGRTPDKKVDKVATSIKELRMANWGEDFYIKGIDELKSNQQIRTIYLCNNGEYDDWPQ